MRASSGWLLPWTEQTLSNSGPRRASAARVYWWWVFRICAAKRNQKSLQRVLAPPLERPELHHRDGAVARHHAPRHVVATPSAKKEAWRGILEAAVRAAT